MTTEEQVAQLADRYSRRAQAYDALWSPVIRPLGERLIARLPLRDARDVIDVGTGAGALLPALQEAAPGATVLGVDNSAGMLELARDKHPGPLRLMDAQRLEVPSSAFDVALLAFVLFHLPDPQRCLMEVFRALRPGGWVGTATWAAEQAPGVNAIWDEELTAAGAPLVEMLATDSRARCDSVDKMTALLEGAGFTVREAWFESIDHRWPPADHYRYQLEAGSLARLDVLTADGREGCLGRVRGRLAGEPDSAYRYQGEVVLVTAVKGGSDDRAL